MKSNHTKGEWKVTTPNNSQFFIASEYHGAICQMPRSYGSAESEDGMEEAEANANLISSAPKLAEIVMRFLKTGYYSSEVGNDARKVLEEAGFDLFETV